MKNKYSLINILLLSALVIFMPLASHAEGDEATADKSLNPNDEGFQYPRTNEEKRRADRGGVFDIDFDIFGSGDDATSTPLVQSNVNRYLWQASLDVLSFMPLSSSDFEGGVIITDWYSNYSNDTSNQQEKIKVNVTIKSSELQASSLNVQVFKKIKSGQEWLDQKASNELKEQIEEKILSQARELKLRDKEMDV